MTVEQARREYLDQAEWLELFYAQMRLHNVWHGYFAAALHWIGNDIEAASIAYDLAVAEQIAGDQRLHTCRACSGGGRIANPGSLNASRRVVCQDCHGIGAVYLEAIA